MTDHAPITGERRTAPDGVILTGKFSPPGCANFGRSDRREDLTFWCTWEMWDRLPLEPK